MEILISRKELKLEAKQLTLLYGTKPTHAHEIIAKSYGFRSYNHYLATLKSKK